MRRVLSAIAIALALSFAVAGVVSAQANKVTTSGSTAATFPINTTATLLSATIKTSTNADLLVSFTSECDLGIGDFDQSQRTVFTGNTTFNQTFIGASNGSSGVDTNAFSSANASATTASQDQAFAQVRVWVEIDGVPVRVQANNPDGSVVLCNRNMFDFNSDSLNLATILNTELDSAIGVFGAGSPFVQHNLDTTTTTGTQIGVSEQEFKFNAGAQANGFNWHAKNVGNGTHTVEVKAHVFAFISSAAGAFTGGGFGGSGSASAFGQSASGSGGGGGGFGASAFQPTDPPFITGSVGKRTLTIEPVNMGK